MGTSGIKREPKRARARRVKKESGKQGKARRVKKESGSAAGTRVRGVDWGKVKWGAFTESFKRYRAQHPSTRAKDLRGFASLVLRHPSRFSPILRRRALFYRNVILRGKL
jgi:hypothetical protein